VSLSQKLGSRDLYSLSDAELAALQTEFAHTGTGIEKKALRNEAERRMAAQPPVRAKITGIDIPFGDLVLFYIKASFAAIPAGIIVVVVVFAIRGVLVGK